MDIDYSSDSGSNWTSIVSATTNDGSYSWTPSAATTTGRIRITYSGIVDTSNADFTITCPALPHYRGSAEFSSSIVSFGSRQFLQAVDGTLYFIVREHSTAYTYIYSSSNGGQTWSVLSYNTDGIEQVKAAIDSNEVIHLYYSRSSNGYQYYRTYTPSNDTWSAATTVYSGANYKNIGGIDVDADGNVYILAQTSTTLSYQVKTSGGWQSAVQLDSVGYGGGTYVGPGTIMVDTSASIHILAHMNSNGNIYYWNVGSVTKELISSGTHHNYSMTLDELNYPHFVYSKDSPSNIFYRYRTSGGLQSATTIVSGGASGDLNISRGRDGFVSITRAAGQNWEGNSYYYVYHHTNSSGSWVQSTLLSNASQYWNAFTVFLKPQFDLGVGIPQTGISLTHNSLNANIRLTYLGTSTLAYPSTCP